MATGPHSQIRRKPAYRELRFRAEVLRRAQQVAEPGDPIVRAAADILCQELMFKLTGARPSDRYFRSPTSLGEKIAEGKFASISGIDGGEILMKYDG